MNKKMSMKKTVKRVTRSLALVAVAALLLVCGLGCAQLQAVGKLLSASTPTPLPTPEPTPTPTPTLVPLVALTPEEEAKAIAELGIVDPDTKEVSGSYSVIGFITASGEPKVIMVVGRFFGENRTGIYDVFTDELLFTMTFIEGAPPVQEFTPESPIREMEAVNPYFKGAAVNVMAAFFYISEFGNRLGYSTNDLFSTLIPKLDDQWIIADSYVGIIYVNMVPEQFRVKASDLIPDYGSTPEPEA